MDRSLHPFTEARVIRQLVGHDVRRALMFAPFHNALALGFRQLRDGF